mmetsp:Transcript_51511/g.81713  ORF Transcript_51511/g.81713 Transcript_51511/m.81713 type:complete len:176 (-) Transcript_51511:175-702(-)
MALYVHLFFLMSMLFGAIGRRQHREQMLQSATENLSVTLQLATMATTRKVFSEGANMFKKSSSTNIVNASDAHASSNLFSADVSSMIAATHVSSAHATTWGGIIFCLLIVWCCCGCLIQATMLKNLDAPDDREDLEHDLTCKSPGSFKKVRRKFEKTFSGAFNGSRPVESLKVET